MKTFLSKFDSSHIFMAAFYVACCFMMYPHTESLLQLLIVAFLVWMVLLIPVCLIVAPIFGLLSDLFGHLFEPKE